MILLACFLLSGCGGKPKGAPHAGGMGPVSVVVAKASVEPVAKKISLIGTLEPNESVEIKSELDGVISRINFQEGSSVRKDDLLFQIDKEKLEAALAEARANLKLAKSNLDRFASLAKTGAVSEIEYDKTQAAYEVGEATVKGLEEHLKDATILAPFDGFIGERSVSVGQYVTKGTMLSYLVNTDPIKAAMRIPERYLSQISPGQNVEIRIAAYPRETFSGTVYFIGPKIDEQTRTVLVKARLENPEGKLRSGMFVNLDLILENNLEAIVIPETALIIEGTRTSIFVVDENDLVHPREVKIGIRLERMIEITEGLSGGEIVVTEGTQKLRPGAAVSYQKSEPVKTLA